MNPTRRNSLSRYLSALWPRARTFLRSPSSLPGLFARGDLLRRLNAIRRSANIPEPENGLIFHNQASMANYANLLGVYDCASELNRKGIEGNFVEVGVWRGGMLALMAAVAVRSQMPRHVWGFDSFEGFKEPAPEDQLEDGSQPVEAGQFAVDVEGVRNLLHDQLGFDRSLITLSKGFIEQTITEYDGAPIALLDLDVDVYEGYKASLVLLDFVVPGGIVFLDEYFADGWPGCRRAVDEVLAERGVEVEIQPCWPSNARGMFEWPGSN